MAPARSFPDGAAARSAAPTIFALLAWALASLFAVALLAPAAEAQPRQLTPPRDAPGWTLCNETSYMLDAATARPAGTSTVVEGWIKLRPGECETVMGDSLVPGLHYFYAKSSGAHRGGLREWGGERRLCVDPTGSFNVESPLDCASMGLEGRNFRAVEVSRAKGFRTNLTETRGYDLETAGNAGLQRLLRDAGLYEGALDGQVRAKTREGLADFYFVYELEEQSDRSVLFDLMEQAAKDRAVDIGFRLCNRTTTRIWAAIARQPREAYESRGWWLLEPGGCARVIDEPLKQPRHYVYAEMELEDGTVRALEGSEPFCVGVAKFAIEGRESCEASAYRTARFVLAGSPTEERGLVFEFFDRDFGPAFLPR